MIYANSSTLASPQASNNNQQYDMEGSGPIGLSLIVIIAQIYMDYTIEEALKLAKKEKIKRPRALHVYMDDTFGIIKQNEEKIEHLNFLKCLNASSAKIHLQNRKKQQNIILRYINYQRGKCIHKHHCL